MSSFSTRPAADTKVRAVVWAVAVQVWPLPVFAGVLLAWALIWMTRSGDPVPASMAWLLLVKPAVPGLMLSFALHESAHVVCLKRIPTVTHITIARTAWRTSVIPEGTMTARQTAVVAVAGPFACALVGALLWLPGLDRALAWWYLAHLGFLLPCFGDGRALLHGLRVRSRDGRRGRRG
ncbi:hypothetical protein [Streptomyces zingiberis]|uniref:DUF3267 domain-containing protein n=1 Tax=Streptomyces zingiberis TaxID=2053010 RepID=A0ABX1BVZ1_9ACTN|nr:hypothetical protein [Streptomyces zingiberis]NJQ01889.1 hypothetical protein [Streptomyces zingiberis]